MSNIVAFKPDRRSRPVVAAEDGASAAILFFTGVRYVRVLDLEEVAIETDATVVEVATLARDKAERLQA